MKKLLSFVFFFVFSMLLFSVTAFAYIDPSAMTYIIQIIAGVAIAAGAAFGFYWRKIKRVFTRHKKDAEYEEMDYGDDDEDGEGYGDYELDDSLYSESEIQNKANVVLNEREGSVSKQILSNSQTRTVKSAVDDYKSGIDVSEYEINEDIIISSGAADKYDEGSGNDMLIRENRELRRLLAEEKEKVEILKKSLHICTKPTKR